MMLINIKRAFVLTLLVLSTGKVFATGTTECSDCDGKLTNIIFRYDGDFSAFIEIDAQKGNRSLSLFAGTVGAGGQFTVSGSDNFLDNKATLGPKIYIRVDGESIGSLHTSCSQPIGPGTTIGDLVVLAATSRNGGLTCPFNGGIPTIDIRKQEEGPDERRWLVSSGDQAPFEIQVTNTGAIELNNVSVSDPLGPQCDNLIGSLAPGESITYSCIVTVILRGTFTNEACASGESANGNASDCDTSSLVISGGAG